MYKIIGSDGKEYGPITTEQLRQWIAQGRANQQTRVLPEGATEWKTIGELPEFAAAVPTIAPITAGIPAPAPAAAEMVNGPAVGLIVTAIVGAVAQVVSLIANLVGASFMAQSRASQPA